MALGTTNLPRVVIYGGMDQSDHQDLLEELCIPHSNITKFKGKNLGEET